MRTPLAFLLVLLMAITATSLAGAQTAKPEPGCAGNSAVDPAGDQEGLTVTPGENYDLTALFFLTKSNKTTANLKIKNLTKDVPSGATDVNWYVDWTAGDAVK